MTQFKHCNTSTTQFQHCDTNKMPILAHASVVWNVQYVSDKTRPRLLECPCFFPYKLSYIGFGITTKNKKSWSLIKVNNKRPFMAKPILWQQQNATGNSVQEWTKKLQILTLALEYWHKMGSGHFDMRLTELETPTENQKVNGTNSTLYNNNQTLKVKPQRSKM